MRASFFVSVAIMAGVVTSIVAPGPIAWAQSVDDSSSQKAIETKPAKAQDEPEPITVSLADGTLELTASGAWKKVDPATRIIEAEFAVLAVDGDSRDGRLTIMRRGGHDPGQLDPLAAATNAT